MHKRRVLIKAGVVRAEGKLPKDNARFVVTNIKKTPRHLYKRVYCGRGDIENRGEFVGPSLLGIPR